jgi:hypothetical protein
MIRQRRAGQEVHLQRAHHPFEVARQDSAARGGIDALKHPMQELDSTARGSRLEPRPHPRIGARSREQSPGQRSIVETRPADEDGPSPPVINVVNRCDRVADVPCRRVLLDRVNDVDDVMWDTSPLIDGHFVGADVETPVDGRGIAADDFAPAFQRQLDAERALAGSRGSKDGEDRRAQCLRPDESESHDDPEQNQQSQLLRARGKRHYVT